MGLVLGERSIEPYEPIGSQYDISDEEKYLLAPPRVLGWSAGRRIWCELEVDGIYPANTRNQHVFDKELQLDDKVKDMIKALVEHHNKLESDEVRNPDLIEGKGQGLVIMLHG